MANSYLPRAEAELVAWLENFSATLTAFGTGLGFSAGEIAAMGSSVTAYSNAVTVVAGAETGLRTAVADRDEKKEAVLALVRAAVPRLQAAPAMTDQTREYFGITVRDAQPTPAGPPATRPVLQVGLAQLYSLVISFADEGTPTKRAKPDGVMGILVQYKKGGDAPAADADWKMLAIDTNTPYTAVFDSADAGAAVWLRGCWLSTRQERGPWSATSSARIPG
jgi:hypothetical protein